MKKIAFIGTHNTGKTTSLHYTSSILKIHGYKNFAVLQESVRSCPYFGMKEYLFKTQLWSSQNQIMNELEANEKKDFVLTDRSVFDQIIYFDVLTGKNGQKNMQEWAELDFLSKIAWSWEKLQPYDLFLLFRPFPMENRIGRMLPPEYQKKIDDAFLRFFSYRYFSDKVYTIQEQNLKTRMKLVSKTILDLLKEKEK